MFGVMLLYVTGIEGLSEDLAAADPCAAKYRHMHPHLARVPFCSTNGLSSDAEAHITTRHCE